MREFFKNVCGDMSMTKKNLVRIFTVILLSTFLLALSTEVSAQPKPSKKARKLAADAGKLYNQGRFSEAVVKYAEALSLSPNFPEARFFKGSSHYKQNQYDLAINELSLALDQGADPQKVYSVRMEVHAAKGDFRAALLDAQKVAELEPNDPYYTAFLGRMYLANSEFQDGLVYLEKSVQQGTRDPNVFYYLAVGYSATGNYAKQGDSADTALKKGTQFSGDSWFLLADALHRERKYARAAQAFENAINAYERDISNNRANSYTEENLYLSYAGLADIYRNMNRFQDAIQISKKGLGLRPNDGNLHISLTWYYSLAGKREEAIIAGKKAIQLAPDQYMAYTNLCRAYNDEAEFFYDKEAFQMATRSFNSAIEQCKLALKLEPNDGETNYYLGRAYFYLDNEKLSKAHYRKSVDGLITFTENNPEYSDGFYLLGNAYFATEDYENAIDAYEKCLAIAPRFARVRYNLGYVYNAAGKEEKAREQIALLEPLDAKLAKKLLEVIEDKD
jgi:tetratricopeptide (TPR) repeat protein